MAAGPGEVHRGGPARPAVPATQLFLLTALLALAAALLLVPAAQATVPGRNGEIAFVSNRDGTPDLFRIKASGSGLNPLLAAPLAQLDPSLTADPGIFAYTQTRGGGNSDIHLLAPGGDERLTFHNSSNHSPTADPSGIGAFYVSDRDGDEELRFATLIDLEPFRGAAARRLREMAAIPLAKGRLGGRLTKNEASDRDPHLLASGGSLVFTSDREGSDDIWSTGFEGESRLTDWPGSERHPAFSPDGSTVAFSADRHGNDEIYLLDPAAGGPPARLTHNAASDTEPVFSPDGRRIAFTSDRDGNREIYVMNADGSGVRNLTESPFHDYSPDWQAKPPPVFCFIGRSFRRIDGTGAPDALIGTARREIIRGRGGRDTIRGRGADDCLYGQSRGDIIFGSRGDDSLVGGGGFDRLNGARGADFLHGGPSADLLQGGASGDSLVGAGGDDDLQGGPGDDFLIGRAGRDRLGGGAGDDFILALAGRDRVRCGRGRDIALLGRAARAGPGCEHTHRFGGGGFAPLLERLAAARAGLRPG